MRTLLLSLLLIVTTGIYSKNVVITGQAPADLNGREVFLLKWDWDTDGYQRVDSMKIKKGKFCFNTEINTGILGKIECPVSGHKYETELFINHDTVSVILAKSVCTIGGNSDNIRYNNFLKEIYNEENMRMKFINSELCKDEEMRNFVEESYNIRIQRIKKDFIEMNIKTELGFLLFKKEIKNLDEAEIAKIINYADTTKNWFPPVPLDYDVNKALAKCAPYLKQDTTLTKYLNSTFDLYKQLLKDTSFAIKYADTASPFVDFDVVDTTGNGYKMSDVIKSDKKQYTLIEFWASWCVPCHQFFNRIRDVIKQYPEIRFISVSIDKDNKKWIDDLKKNSLEWEQYRTTDASFLTKYMINGVPSAILIDNNGTVISKEPYFGTMLDKLDEKIK